MKKMSKENNKKDTGLISDGYHTFNELYDYRRIYNVLLFNEWTKNNTYEVYKTKRHSDGEICFGDKKWFMVYAITPYGMIDNHYNIKDWDAFICPEVDKCTVEYDSHTPADILTRMNKLIQEDKNVKPGRKKIIATDDTIKDIVKEEIRKYGDNADLNHIDTSKVTNMAFLFEESTFNGVISQWDTSNVTNMFSMFYNSLFNGDISNWNTSKVTNMKGLFCKAAFNQPIGKWNTSNVTEMRGMFEQNYVFNQDISNWDTSKVTDMCGMFKWALDFNQPLDNWNVSNVEIMHGMFCSAESFNHPLNNWNIANVKDMGFMFAGAKSFTQGLSSWDISDKATDDMFYMTKRKIKKTILGAGIMKEKIIATDETIKHIVIQEIAKYGRKANLHHIDTSRVTNMSSLFIYSNFNGDISGWDTSNVVNMDYMFESAKNFNCDISNWNVSKVESMHRMFYGTDKFNQPIGKWNVKNVKNMRGMFKNTKAFNQDISDWDIDNVQNMNYMFDNAERFSQPLITWDWSSKFTTDMFANIEFERLKMIKGVYL